MTSNIELLGFPRTRGCLPAPHATLFTIQPVPRVLGSNKADTCRAGCPVRLILTAGWLAWYDNVRVSRKHGVFIGGNEVAGWLFEVAACLYQLTEAEVLVKTHYHCPHLWQSAITGRCMCMTIRTRPTSGSSCVASQSETPP